MLETGDTGVTTLLFPLTMVPPVAGDVTVEYIAGPVGLEGEAGSAVVSFDAAGFGTLSIDVPNDDVDDVTDISVLLTAVTGTDVELGATLVATGTVAEDDAIDPADIDGDGILNIDDPFAYDGTNGGARALVAGGEFTQNFDTADHRSVQRRRRLQRHPGEPGLRLRQSGRSGAPIPMATARSRRGVTDRRRPPVDDLVRPKRTAFQIGNRHRQQHAADGYQSAVDVTGVNSFEVHARASSADWLGGDGPNGFAQFGIRSAPAAWTISSNWSSRDGGSSAPRVQIAPTTRPGDRIGTQLPDRTAARPDASISSLVGDIEFRLIVDRAAGTVDRPGRFLRLGRRRAADKLHHACRRPSSRTAASIVAMKGANPLTGGDGRAGLRHLRHRFRGDNNPKSVNNQITADYDFLTDPGAGRGSRGAGLDLRRAERRRGGR